MKKKKFANRLSIGAHFGSVGEIACCMKDMYLMTYVHVIFWCYDVLCHDILWLCYVDGCYVMHLLSICQPREVMSWEKIEVWCAS